MNAIETEKLSFEVGGKAILSEVTFALTAGERLSVIGPNGAGKTTLLRCLMGMLPARGEVSIFDKPLRSYTRRELAKRVSYVPQPDGAYVPFSVFEFVLMGRYPHWSPFSTVSSDDKAIAQRALEMTDTAAFTDRAMDTLSGGERQRVTIAGALAQGHELLLLDEPTAFLDYKHQVEIRALLRRLCRENGVTIVSVTHDAAAAFESDAVLALKVGRVAFLGKPAELYDGEILERVYDTPFHITRGTLENPPLVAPIELGG